MSEKKKQDEDLDEALDDTFPSSDPIPIGGGITGDEEPPPQPQPQPAKKKDESLKK
ncbi:hypothetical protein SAMN07250955_102320 [Arboricoccus pini]|uniref:Uncharacterized protein n=1 Tax=Arboricoccus pini TaxID=1963835 RepID=A0A212QQA7_9PROT|nr:hypothetical protein [Arboricoccus pini]SNB61654.1 hypothetical protein SAMN07250955_102320 [Arboricoccus pini]